jgi:hypothetical protein
VSYHREGEGKACFEVLPRGKRKNRKTAANVLTLRNITIKIVVAAIKKFGGRPNRQAPLRIICNKR